MDNTRKQITLATHYLSIGRPTNALRTLEDGAGQMIEYPEFWRLRCQALYQLERFDDVRETAQEGLARDPGDSDLFHWLSHAERQLGDLAAAERSQLACLEKGPNQPGYLACYAELLLRAAKLDEAEYILNEAARLSPEHPRVREVQVLYASVRYDGKRAQEVARQFIASAPEHPFGHAALGVATYECGEISEAKRHFGAAVELNPEQKSFRSAFHLVQWESRPILLPLAAVRRLGVARVLIIQIISLLIPLWMGYSHTAGLLFIVWVAFWLFITLASIAIQNSSRRQSA